MAKRLLVVDDEMIIRDPISLYLEELGYEVEHAENGVEALHLICSKDYDLVILDISMPYMNGHELSQALKDEGKNVPLLVISAKDPSTPLQQEAGRLIKPFSLKTLAREIESILNAA